MRAIQVAWNKVKACWTILTKKTDLITIRTADKTLLAIVLGEVK